MGFFYFLLRNAHQKYLKRYTHSSNNDIWVVDSTSAGGVGRTQVTASFASHLSKRSNDIIVLCSSMKKEELELSSPLDFSIYTDDAIFLKKKTDLRVFQVKNKSNWLKTHTNLSGYTIICDGGIEDPCLSHAKKIILQEEVSEKYSQLYPLGRHRSFSRQIKPPFKPMILGQDYHFVHKVANSTVSTLITSGGNPQKWKSELVTGGLKIKRLIAFKNHDPHFEKRINDFFETNPNESIALGTKELTKLSSASFNSKIIPIETHLKLRQPWSYFLNSFYD